jgi:hypothetical protein
VKARSFKPSLPKSLTTNETEKEEGGLVADLRENLWQ